MKSLTLSAVALALALASGTVIAGECPADMKQNDGGGPDQLGPSVLPDPSRRK